MESGLFQRPGEKYVITLALIPAFSPEEKAGGRMEVPRRRLTRSASWSKLYPMNSDDILNETKDAYLCLIHPVRQGDSYRKEISSVVALAPSVPDELIASMIFGPSWRERLLGLGLAMAKQPEIFIGPIFKSLRDPRGIAIVPACAVLAALTRRSLFPMTPSFAASFNRLIFDGELGWATDKAMYLAGLSREDVPGRGPNYGQIFEDHVDLYTWILKNPHPR